jgi:hypothetical protein
MVSVATCIAAALLNGRPGLHAVVSHTTLLLLDLLFDRSYVQVGRCSVVL